MKDTSNSKNNYYLSKYNKEKKTNNKDTISYSSIYSNKNKKVDTNTKAEPFEKIVEDNNLKENKSNIIQTEPTTKSTNHSKKRLSAIFLLLIGLDSAVDIVKYFDEKEIVNIGSEILNVDNITEEEYNLVEKHFGPISVDDFSTISGSKEFIRQLLQKSFGIDKGSNYFLKCIEENENNKLLFLESLTKEKFFAILKNESDIVVSLILSLISPKKSAQILSLYNSEKLTSIVRMMAKKSELSQEVINTIVEKIREKAKALQKEEGNKVSGKNKLAEILKYSNPNDAENIIDDLENYDKNLAEEIKDKIFTFSDILTIPKSEFEKILKIHNDQEIAFLLKGATDEMKDFFLSCVTKRRRRNITDEMRFLGKVKKKDVEQKRKEFCRYLKHLESLGKVILKYNSDEFI